MKSFVRIILCGGALAIGTSGLLSAQGNNGWFEQWHKAKFGRVTPLEEARQTAELANVAFREVGAGEAEPPARSWFDEWYRAKFGRSSPAEGARRKAELANTAFREEVVRELAPPTAHWFDQWYRAKFGRPWPGR